MRVSGFFSSLLYKSRHKYKKCIITSKVFIVFTLTKPYLTKSIKRTHLPIHFFTKVLQKQSRPSNPRTAKKKPAKKRVCLQFMFGIKIKSSGLGCYCTLLFGSLTCKQTSHICYKVFCLREIDAKARAPAISAKNETMFFEITFFAHYLYQMHNSRIKNCSLLTPS